jgi:hypothetical protein
MRIYSNIITRDQVYNATVGIEGVYVDNDGVKTFSPRVGGNGYVVYLEGMDDRHRRARNQRDGMAATWDDWGVFIARLYAIDKDARIGWYDSRDHFIEITSQAVSYGRAPGVAPWLTEDITTLLWPDTAQKERDAALIARCEKKAAQTEARRLRARADALVAQYQ